MSLLLRIERSLLVFCALGLGALIVWWTSLTYPALSRHGLPEQVSTSFAKQGSRSGAEHDERLSHDAVRWRKVVQAIAADRVVLARCRMDPDHCPDPARRLLEIIETARAKEGRARIGEVNRALNLSIAYTSDLVQHGLDDVWTAPLLTLASGRGDCEDYAIAKYLALLELGVRSVDVRIVILETKPQRQHAVLATRLGQRWVMLDNAHSLILEDRQLPYRSIAAFGGEDDSVRPAAPTRINIAAR
jgi:predicted transglutaminase-like cysteine proteinase